MIFYAFFFFVSENDLNSVNHERLHYDLLFVIYSGIDF